MKDCIKEGVEGAEVAAVAVVVARAEPGDEAGATKRRSTVMSVEAVVETGAGELKHQAHICVIAIKCCSPSTVHLRAACAMDCVITPSCMSQVP